MNQNSQAGDGPLERPVRPSLYEYRINATWTNYSASLPPDDAFDAGTLRIFYDQTTLDAAVAAERERWQELAEHLRYCRECGETDVIHCHDGSAIWKRATGNDPEA